MWGHQKHVRRRARALTPPRARSFSQRFSNNAFFLLPSEPTTVRYIPFWGRSSADYDALVATLRVEHVASYL